MTSTIMVMLSAVFAVSFVRHSKQQQPPQRIVAGQAANHRQMIRGDGQSVHSAAAGGTGTNTPMQPWRGIVYYAQRHQK